MSRNKKYYYMKLKEDFFESNEMLVLQSMDDGYVYSDILLKMYLRSLKQGGRLMVNEMIPMNEQMLATITRHAVSEVHTALEVFKELGLIEVLDNGTIYMLEIQNFIGKSSTEADRIRNYREKIKTENTPAIEEGCTNVRKGVYKCTPEIEIEKEIDIEREEKLYDSANIDVKEKTPKTRPNSKKTEEKSVEEMRQEWKKFLEKKKLDLHKSE